MPTITLFPDTNIFMHGKALSTMPWAELGGSDIDLVIAYPVQREIDAHKRAGGRKGKRAREAATLVRELLQLPGHTKVIRDAGPRVTIRLIPTLRPNRALDDHLDLAHADDALVNSILAFAAENPGVDVRLLSDDTGTAMTAGQVGATFKLVSDDWMAKPEDDPSEKSAREYRAKYERLLAQEPEVHAVATGIDGGEISELRLTLRRCRPLSELEVDALMSQVTNAFPPSRDFGSAATDPRPDDSSFPQFVGTRGPTTYEYEAAGEPAKEEYTHKLHPAWLAEIRSRLKWLHEAHNSVSARPGIQFSLTNAGTRHATQVLVEIRCRGDILLAPPNEGEGEPAPAAALPLPPKPPRGRWRSGFRSAFDALGRAGLTPERPFNAFPLIPSGREPNKFYWRDGRPVLPADRWVFECEEWRHQDEPELFSVRILEGEGRATAEGAVQLRVRAANLSDLYEMVIPVRLQFEDVDTFELARQLVDDLITRADAR